MPTIVFVSPKGGVGKTTAALLLATEIARATPVTVIDADPNRPIQTWASKHGPGSSLTIVGDADEENIIDRIEEAAAATPFVIVDLEGTAAKIVVLAVSQADFVIIPTQGSKLDADQASRAIKVVRQHEKITRRKMPFAVLLTRTSPVIKRKELRHIQESLREAGVPVLSAQLDEREAYRAMFSYQVRLDDLASFGVSNVDKAVANAQTFAGEVVAALRSSRQEGEGSRI